MPQPGAEPAADPAVRPAPHAATLVVVEPAGRRARVPLVPAPFRLGRALDNHLILRDSRVSRYHARLFLKDGQYVIEDLGSRHGVWVNGERIVKTRTLRSGDRIEFGVPDGYQVHFTSSADELHRLLERPVPGETGRSGSANLEKLRAVLEVGRSLQTSFSVDDVLNAVLDAALAVTGADRGFLLLFNESRQLEVRSARSSAGGDLAPADLRIPHRLIQHALESRRDLFSMSFDSAALDGYSPGNTIADLELRSVVCLPLVRVNPGQSEATRMLSVAHSSAGVLYLDSRIMTVALAGGDHELLQTLAIEASTVLENARLLEEERARQRIEEELDVARRIQQSLLPRSLPEKGWFVACGSSQPSHQVGGDYFDAVPVGESAWSMVIADVAGKGVSSALLASFLQGAFLSASCSADIPAVLMRLNAFLHERAAEGKYATLFYSTLDSEGLLTYANAGHCPPLLVRANGLIEKLEATSMPVGIAPQTAFHLASCRIHPRDRLVLYTDGVTEAQNADEEIFGRKRLNAAVRRAAGSRCRDLYESIRTAVTDFTAGAEQSDDLTLVVIGYQES